MPSHPSFLGGYATCFGCTTLFEKKELDKDGMCASCAVRVYHQRQEAMARADQRSISLAAKKILADAAKTRTEPVSPGVVDSFMRKLGGPEGFGEIIAEEIQKARGKIQPGPGDTWKASQHQTLKLLELASRVFLANDQREETSFANLTDEELVNTLRGLAAELVKDNDEFRRLICIEAIRQQPDLIHELMSIAGMPVLDAPVVEEQAAEEVVDFRNAGLDEEDAGESQDD